MTIQLQSTSPKHNQYQILVQQRKICDLCSGLTNPSCARASKKHSSGHLDSNQIGPYSQWHHDLDARLMVIAKDFAPVKKFIQYGGWPGSDVKTNKRLSYYLTYAGFSVGSISEGHDASGLFFTNAVLCLPGGEHMRTYVKTTDVKMCSRKFLCQLISLVNPKSIAALGEHATNAVFEAVGLEQPLSFSNLISEDEGYQLPSGPRLFAVWHPVASNSSKRPITSKDHIAAWSRIGNWLKAND